MRIPGPLQRLRTFIRLAARLPESIHRRAVQSGSSTSAREPIPALLTASSCHDWRPMPHTSLCGTTDRRNERRRKSRQDLACGRRRSLLRQSRHSEMHFVAALDRVPQMRCVLGLLKRGDGRCRRLLPHEGASGLGASAPRSRPRQRACQYPQCTPRPLRNDCHRRPACDMASRP